MPIQHQPEALQTSEKKPSATNGSGTIIPNHSSIQKNDPVIWLHHHPKKSSSFTWKKVHRVAAWCSRRSSASSFRYTDVTSCMNELNWKVYRNVRVNLPQDQIEIYMIISDPHQNQMNIVQTKIIKPWINNFQYIDIHVQLKFETKKKLITIR